MILVCYVFISGFAVLLVVILAGCDVWLGEVVWVGLVFEVCCLVLDEFVLEWIFISWFGF